MYGQDVLCGISKVPFEIPHKLSSPYIERDDVSTTLKFLRFKSSEAFLKRPLLFDNFVRIIAGYYSTVRPNISSLMNWTSNIRRSQLKCVFFTNEIYCRPESRNLVAMSSNK